MTFVEMMDSIRAMAYGLTKTWKNKFVVDELVNEAWIQSLKNNYTDPPLIMRAAKFDMIDYIRTHVGKESYYTNGKKQPAMFKPRYTTNCTMDKEEGWEHPNTFFDGEYYDKNFKNLENSELIQMLLSFTTTKRATAMIHCYLEEKSLIETGALMGLRDTTVCNILKEGREDCNDEVVRMELEYSEI